MSAGKGKKRTPEEELKRGERIVHLEKEAGVTAAGAIAGAAVGAIAGPVGAAAGAVMGAAVGALVGVGLEQEDHRQADHDRELDAIGLPDNKVKKKGEYEDEDEEDSST